MQIAFRDMDRSPPLAAVIREKTNELERVAPDPVACRVTVAQEVRHRHQGRDSSVRLDITTRGKEVAFTRKQHEDAFVAARASSSSKKPAPKVRSAALDPGRSRLKESRRRGS